MIIAAILLNTLCLGLDSHSQDLFEDSICSRRCELDPAIPAEDVAKCSGPLFNRTFDADGQGGGVRFAQNASFCFIGATSALPHSEECGKLRTSQECWGSLANCYWFEGDGHQKCKHGLYTPESFARVGGLQGEPYNAPNQELSLRHICGDRLDGCPAFNLSLNSALEGINTVLTFFFIAEMVIKMLGLGFWGYFEDRFNQFDCFVVTASIFELAFIRGDAGSNLSALRGMRLFRLFKLARSWKSMRQILGTLGVALGSLGPLTLVWVIFMYIFALLGMQYVGGEFRFVKSDTPRSNFDSFFPSSNGHGAFIVTFQIITTENWNTVMYNSIMATKNPLAALLTISIVIFGNYIIMNLFISILLQGFGEDEDETEEQVHEGKAFHMSDRFRRLIGKSRGKIGAIDDSPLSHGDAVLQNGRMPFGLSIADRLHSLESNVAVELYSEVDVFRTQVQVPKHNSFYLLSPENPFRAFCCFIAHHNYFDLFILICILISSVTLILERPDDMIVASECPRAPAALDCSGLLPGQTELINCPMQADDPGFRAWGACGSKDAAPCCATQAKMDTLGQMDVVFTLIFLIEMVMKMVADGLVLHKRAYLRSPWNLLDSFIVIISIINVSTDSSGSIRTLKSLRAVRAVRPLRVIKRNPGLKIAVECLLSSIPSMINVGVVCLLWFSMYAMLGVQFFKGELYRCYDPENQLFYGTAFFPLGNTYTATQALSGPGAVPTIVECVSRTNGGGVWQGRDYSFDSYPKALLTLFEMATTEGWLDVMNAVVDKTGTGVTPLPNNNPWYALYCVCHIVVGAFVLLNLIVGSIINNYTKIKKENDGLAPYMTPEQQKWKETQKFIADLRPQRRQEGPEGKVRMLMFKIANSHQFEVAITIAIVLNILTMMTKTHDQSDCFTAVIFWINVTFTVIFVLEANVKLIGLGFKWYFHDGWNIFDFVVAILSCIIIGLDVVNGEYSCSRSGLGGVPQIPALQILRAFRIARVFRLIRRAKGLRIMIQTLIISLPALWNIGVLIALFIIIFAVLGTTAFYNTNLEQDLYGRMDPTGSYVTFDNAIWVLFRQTTGEGWNGMLYYTSRSDLYLGCAKRYGAYFGDGCGGPISGVGFHVFWQLFGTYVMMQLFTAIILENFDDMARDDGSSLPHENLDEFVKIWSQFDKNGDGDIPSEKLPKLICELSPPLGIKARTAASSSELIQVIKDLAIPIQNDDRVTYHDTFLACVKRVMLQGGEEEETVTNVATTDSTSMLRNASTTNKIFRGRFATVAEDYAARLLQKACHEWRERRIQYKKGVNLTRQIPNDIPNDDDDGSGGGKRVIVVW